MSNYICYVTSLSHFNEPCYEDKNTNRMIESLNAFKDVCNDPELKEKPFIVIFNKLDIFKKKIQHKEKYEDFLHVFPEYNDGHDEHKILEFITNEFLNLHERPKSITFYYSNAIEADSIKEIFDDIFGFKFLEKKELIDPKENILLHSKFISQLHTYDSIKELFDKYDLDKSGLLEEGEWKNFLEGISKESETLTQEILESLKPIMDLDKDGKVSYKEFLSFTSKVKPPGFIICGPQYSGKSLLLKSFGLYESELLEMTNIKPFMYENLHSLMLPPYQNDYDKIIEKYPNSIYDYESFMLKNDVFRVYHQIIKDDTFQKYFSKLNRYDINPN